MIKLTKNLGMILLAIWLIVTGLIRIFDITFPAAGTVLDLLAIAAGVVILIGLWGKSLPSNLGTILLAIWLILTGLLSLLSLSFAGSAIVFGVLALAAGVLLLLGR